MNFPKKPFKSIKYLVDTNNIVYEYNIEKKGTIVVGQKIIKSNNKFSIKFD